MAIKKETGKTTWREAWGILLLAFCILMLLSLISYEPKDLSVFQSPPHVPVKNFIGPVGAWLAFITFMMFGVCGYLVPMVLGVQSILMLVKREGRLWPKALWMFLMLLSLGCIFELQKGLWDPLITRLNLTSASGLTGYIFAQRIFIRLIGEIGTAILSGALLFAGLVSLFEMGVISFFQRILAYILNLWGKIKQWKESKQDWCSQIEREEKEISKRRRRLEQTLSDRRSQCKQKKAVEAKPKPQQPLLPIAEVSSKKPQDVSQKSSSIFTVPPLSILDDLPSEKSRVLKGDVQKTGIILKDTLADFGVEVDVTNIEQGPVVTSYELLPAPGIRVERIAGLSNNIALAMKAQSVRVQAPIPGKGVVGIEIPNSKANMVFIREILESDVWQDEGIALPLALGKDVGGKDLVADLADMPHMLIAGATGAGKTVCMNSILAGLLMSRTPDEMKLMLVDPKIVEFSGYNHLPHLVVPVITDPKKVGLGLRWAINEMEKRYKIMAKVGVRNIKSYNSRPVVKKEEVSEGSLPLEDKDRPPERLPYIVIIVDELADLMMVAQAEIENSIARLAQLSRAVGIHMILATQRPSVNVITGTIKANFPARLAFQVAQKVDSRTILDAIGADKLLGKGDMLFLSPRSGKLIRAQGTMTSDPEINRIVEYIKEQGAPEYVSEIKEKIENKAPAMPEADDADNDVIDAAIEIIRQTKRASTSSLQRRLRIGYTRAARIMDLLEERGVVGPPRGSDPREILIDLEGEIPENTDGVEE